MVRLPRWADRHAGDQEPQPHLDAVLRAAPYGLALIDPGSGPIVQANARFAEIAGREPDALVGTSWTALSHPDDAQSQAEELGRLHDGSAESIHLRKRWLKPDGSLAWVRITVTRLTSPAGGEQLDACFVEDITSQLKSEELVRKATRTLQLATEAADIGTWSWDATDRLMDYDERMCEWYEVPEEMRDLGVTIEFWRGKVHPEDVELVEERLTTALEQQTSFEQQFRIVRADGEVRHLLSAGMVEADERGVPVRIVGFDRDVTAQRRLEEELRRANEELRALARHDLLTGLPNRVVAAERLNEEHLRTRRTESPYAVLLIGVDGLSAINEAHGPATGDAVLQHIAHTITSTIRETDFSARFDAEEFLVIMPDTALEGGIVAAEHLRERIEARPETTVGPVTVSIGLATSTCNEIDETCALDDAAMWLRKAQEAGGNTTIHAEI